MASHIELNTHRSKLRGREGERGRERERERECDDANIVCTTCTATTCFVAVDVDVQTREMTNKYTWTVFWWQRGMESAAMSAQTEEKIVWNEECNLRSVAWRMESVNIMKNCGRGWCGMQSVAGKSVNGGSVLGEVERG